MVNVPNDFSYQAGWIHLQVHDALFGLRHVTSTVTCYDHMLSSNLIYERSLSLVVQCTCKYLLKMYTPRMYYYQNSFVIIKIRHVYAGGVWRSWLVQLVQKVACIYSGLYALLSLTMCAIVSLIFTLFEEVVCM